MTKPHQKSWTNAFNLVRNLWRSFSFSFKEYPAITVTIIILIVMSGILPVFASKTLGELINALTVVNDESNGIRNVWIALITYGILTAVPEILSILRAHFDRIWLMRLQDKLEIAVLEKRITFDIAQLQDKGFLDFMRRAFNNSIYPIINILADGVESVKNLVLAGGSAIAVLILDWRAFLLVLLTSLPEFIIEMRYGGRIWSIFSQHSYEQRRQMDLRTYVTNKTNAIDARLFGVLPRFIKYIREILNKFTDDQLKEEKSRTFAKSTSTILSIVGLLLAISLFVSKSIDGAIAVGTVVFALQSLGRFSDQTGNTLTRIAKMLERNLYVTDIFTVLDTKPILKQPDKPYIINNSKTPKIEFKNVWFKYPGQENWALKSLNLSINPGEKIGLVGNNGSGKTTLILLLLRIYDPIDGEILIDGKNIKEVDQKEWWRMLGVLLQDFASYNFTIKESISIGKRDFEEISGDRVREASRKSTAESFVSLLPKRENEMIGVEFGGIEPSKGQKQKLAIARALYKDAKLLILDEPTASIDAESASIIFNEIENLPKDVSAILISHNFATIKRADRIIVMSSGEIIEQGSHDELIKLNGQYKGAFDKQRDDFIN